VPPNPRLLRAAHPAGRGAASYALASALAARGQDREALELFLDIVARNRRFKDDGARTAMLAIFDRLGKDSDLVSEFRRRLQIVL
jgi:putative thioredoxin